MLKSTGIVRRLDELGRIVLPIDLRRKLDICDRDSLEIFTDGDTVVLKKYQVSCVFCSNADNLTDFNGKNVCRECIAAFASLNEQLD